MRTVAQVTITAKEHTTEVQATGVVETDEGKIYRRVHTAIQLAPELSDLSDECLAAFSLAICFDHIAKDILSADS
jgi:hypothetical protein